MDIATIQRTSSTAVRPFDPQNRDRIEEVATALLDLCGRLETKIDAQSQRLAELELQMQELGMVPRG